MLIFCGRSGTLQFALQPDDVISETIDMERRDGFHDTKKDLRPEVFFSITVSRRRPRECLAF